jgi:hypothetical protein
MGLVDLRLGNGALIIAWGCIAEARHGSETVVDRPQAEGRRPIDVSLLRR